MERRLNVTRLCVVLLNIVWYSFTLTECAVLLHTGPRDIKNRQFVDSCDVERFDASYEDERGFTCPGFITGSRLFSWRRVKVEELQSTAGIGLIVYVRARCQGSLECDGVFDLAMLKNTGGENGTANIPGKLACREKVSVHLTSVYETVEVAPSKKCFSVKNDMGSVWLVLGIESCAEDQPRVAVAHGTAGDFVGDLVSPTFDYTRAKMISTCGDAHHDAVAWEVCQVPVTSVEQSTTEVREDSSTPGSSTSGNALEGLPKISFLVLVVCASIFGFLILQVFVFCGVKWTVARIKKRRAAASNGNAMTDKNVLIEDQIGNYIDEKIMASAVIQGVEVGCQNGLSNLAILEVTDLTPFAKPLKLNFPTQFHVKVGTANKFTGKVECDMLDSYSPHRYTITYNKDKFSLKYGQCKKISVAVVPVCSTLSSEILVSMRYRHCSALSVKKGPWVTVSASIEYGSELGELLDPAEINIGPILGQGAFGKVYKGVWNGTVVAVKIYDKNNYDTFEELYESVKTEAEKLKSFKCETILGYIGMVLDPEHVCIVTNYAKHGNVADFMKLIRETERGEASFVATTDKNVNLAWKFVQDTATALQYLHRWRILHRDVKPQNVLVVNDDYRSNVCCVLADFGESGYTFISTKPVHQNRADVYGTLAYMAPEVLERSTEYNQKCDVYSFAIYMYSVTHMRDPYDDLEDRSGLCDNVIAGLRPTMMQYYKERYQENTLITKSWDKNPETRPDFDEICDSLREIRSRLNMFEIDGKVRKTDDAVTVSDGEVDENSEEETGAAVDFHPVNGRNKTKNE